MQTHYFIGINIPEAAAKELAEARGQWNLQSHKKYTRPQDMHITLLFIGSAEETQLQEAAQALEEISQAPFDLAINGVKTFGNPQTPRIIYAAIADSAPLMELQEKVREITRKFNLSSDQKPFVPHITLAAKWAGGSEMEEAPVFKMPSISFRVEEFSLFRIEPQNMRKYVPQATYRLQEGV
ncbi:2'-5' RNA ligase [Planomicrobium koreense]|uniref:RNA 2',3'-cyclic phosphodiesterase n=1 Tax=Planococcus koreensis TaxID=112331 RepID=A0A7W8CS15_9BACL|nr:RNA 2',3'-cyclic phosphodiesterase [Planococcus koreensis]MBB5180568.1 2'-5' RNA ligase [Planococcus koreensis]